MIGPLAQRTGKNNAKVFGSADSMIAYMLLFMDNVEALDVSTFRLHRADGYVDNDNDRALLAKINKDLRAKMTKRFDAAVFKEVTGYTIAEMFDAEKRIDIDLDAKQAKKIGLINKIIRLEPKQIAAMSEKLVAFADISFNSRGSENELEIEASRGSETKQNKINVEQKKDKIMTLEELKAQHPGVYSAVFEAGKKQGITEEKDRVEAYLEFVETDPESVKKQIEAGSPITAKFMAEMTKKMASTAMVENLKTEATEEQRIAREKKEKTEAEATAEKFENDVFTSMNLTAEKKEG